MIPLELRDRKGVWKLPRVVIRLDTKVYATRRPVHLNTELEKNRMEKLRPIDIGLLKGVMQVSFSDQLLLS